MEREGRLFLVLCNYHKTVASITASHRLKARRKSTSFLYAIAMSLSNLCSGSGLQSE